MTQPIRELSAALARNRICLVDNSQRYFLRHGNKTEAARFRFHEIMEIRS